MVKIFAIGLWVCVVALGSLMLGIRMNADSPALVKVPEAVKLHYTKTNVFSIPIIIQGKVDGYLISQLGYVVDDKRKKSIAVPLDTLINNAVFEIFWGSYSDTSTIERIKFADVKNEIIKRVNDYVGTPVLQDLLVEQFTYLPSSRVRVTKPAKTMLPEDI
ncbi:hypothetical protein [Bartonella sp. DGB2]|uniref:hypothetical protein n=1 Tax=Bartonella sp. DGB2 TaxID=3388426 RepID=UPI00398FEDCF